MFSFISVLDLLLRHLSGLGLMCTSSNLVSYQQYLAIQKLCEFSIHQIKKRILYDDDDESVQSVKNSSIADEILRAELRRLKAKEMEKDILARYLEN